MSTVHITTLTDSRFLIPTMVMLASARENKAENICYHVHIFQDGLSPWEIGVFKELETETFVVDIDKVRENRFTHLPNCGRHGQIELMRLNLPNVLPDVDRVLFLDGDIVILKDLTSLYNVDLGDCVIAAVRDLVGLIDKEHLRNLSTDEYFNAGVMVMDLARMRRENYVQRFFDDAREVTKFWKYADQDLINYTCAGKIMALSPKYNGITMSYKYRMNADLQLFNSYHHTQYESFRELESEFVLLHWAGNPGKRPWEMSDAACAPVWLYYLQKTPLKHANMTLLNPWREIDEIKAKLTNLQSMGGISNESASVHACESNRGTSTAAMSFFIHDKEIRYGIARWLPLVTVRSAHNPCTGQIKIHINALGIPLVSIKGTREKRRWYLFRLFPIWKRWSN